MEIRSGVVLHEGEISTYYRSHPEHFRRPERVKLAQILLTISPQDTEAEIRRLEQQAQQIQTRLLNGDDFGTVAAEFSDVSEAQQGGDLGYFKKGELLEKIDREVFPLNVGDISDVIRTEQGFHIFKILEKETARTIPYEEVKEQVKEMLFFERSDMAYRRWLKRLRDQAYVEIRM
jgi:parvulin-like peptidyl-prolyl isomerase